MLKPIASIIVLNYNGEKVIHETLTALAELKTEKSDYEVIVVDNNSQDGGRNIIDNFISNKKNFRTHYINKNKGFAGGNNEGIKIAKGKYVILLNNDCIVEKNWLNELIKLADSDHNIFAISSKVMLYAYFKKIKITSDIKKVELIDGDLLRFGKEKTIELPIITSGKDRFVETAFTSNDKFVKISLVNNIDLKIEKNIKVSRQDKDAYQKIQNAGSIIFPDGYGRDIGASVTNKTQDFEQDCGQYSVSRQVFAVCGAACLLKKDILNKIGLLNEDSFMYYEDTDLSERAQLHGYKNYYCSNAIVRHLHAFSSKEWSDFFIFHVEKGRLLHVIAHYPFLVAMSEIIKFIFYSLLRMTHEIIHQIRIKKSLVYIKVTSYILLNFPKLMYKRSMEKYDHKNRFRMYNLLKTGYYLRK